MACRAGLSPVAQLFPSKMKCQSGPRVQEGSSCNPGLLGKGLLPQSAGSGSEAPPHPQDCSDGVKANRHQPRPRTKYSGGNSSWVCSQLDWTEGFPLTADSRLCDGLRFHLAPNTPVPWNRSAWVGVPAVAPWLTNATSIHEDAGLIPGLAP